MASEIDICNVALGHLGDTGTVASLAPPEGSAQAEHCARFYPMARDALLSMHAWGFATRRSTLALLAAPPVGWSYAYAKPADALDILAVQGPTETDWAAGTLTGEPHAYVCEANASGAEVLYCNVENAVVRYVARVQSTTRFPPLFITALTWQLASMLAGPLIKGDAGMAEAKRCAQMAQAYLSRAVARDTDQRHVSTSHTPDWLRARGASPAASGWRD